MPSERRDYSETVCEFLLESCTTLIFIQNNSTLKQLSVQSIDRKNKYLIDLCMYH